MEQIDISTTSPPQINPIPVSQPIQNKVEVKPVNETQEFLAKINSIITSIRKEDGKRYSLLSSIFNCFYENKKLILPKFTINDYIHKDILTYKNKMIISFVENGTNSMETINESNYLKKIQTTISKNKCLLVQNDNISINTDFIHNHKLLIYRNLFGKEIDIVKSSLKPKKLNKIKTSLGPKKIVKNSKKSDKINGIRPRPSSRVASRKSNDFEIEIIENDNDDTEINQKNIYKPIPITPIYLNRAGNFGDFNLGGLNYLNNINTNNNLTNTGLRIPQFLEKKRRNNDIFLKNEIDSDEKSENIIKYGEDKLPEKKEEIIAEKEVMSLIENGKFFLSLFKDKEMLNAIEEQNKTIENSDNYIKKLLSNYENGSYLKNYLLMLNVDFIEFQRSIKNLILTQESLKSSENNKFITQFAVMNKVIMAKEKCNLLIDKIIIKLKQLILEYNFIQKVLGNIELNKNNNFVKFKEVMSNVNKKQEKENYFGEVKNNLQEELRNAIILGKK